MVDVAVERIARDAPCITFWRDCRGDRRSVVIGDPRLRLAETADRRYEVPVVGRSAPAPSQFISSPARAIDLYRRKTAPDDSIVWRPLPGVEGARIWTEDLANVWSVIKPA